MEGWISRWRVWGRGPFFRKGPLPLCFLRLQSLSALECAVTLSVPLRFFKRGAVPVDGGNQIRHELHDFVHIAGAGDLFKAAGRIVQHAQIVGFGQTSDMGGGLADHLRVARLFALDGALQSFIQFRKQGTDGFVRCLALLLSILERPFLSVLCGKGRFLFRCFGNGWTGLLLRSRFAVSGGKDGREGGLLRFGEGGIFFGGRLDNRSHRYAELHNVIDGQLVRACRRARTLSAGRETGRFIQQ